MPAAMNDAERAWAALIGVRTLYLGGRWFFVNGQGTVWTDGGFDERLGHHVAVFDLPREIRLHVVEHATPPS